MNKQLGLNKQLVISCTVTARTNYFCTQIQYEVAHVLAVRQRVTERDFEIISKKIKGNWDFNYAHLGAVNWTLDLQEEGWGYMDWIGLAQDRDRWWTIVSAVMNLRVP